MSSSQRILSIDPGHEKCGIAVVDPEQGAIQQTIISVNQLPTLAEAWVRKYSCPLIVVGDRTGSGQIVQRLAPLLSAGNIEGIVTVTEHKSTEQARRRYWQTHPPVGWRKLLPIGLLIPPCAIDDFAAIILAERYFGRNTKNL